MIILKTSLEKSYVATISTQRTDLRHWLDHAEKNEEQLDLSHTADGTVTIVSCSGMYILLMPRTRLFTYIINSLGSEKFILCSTKNWIQDLTYAR